MPKRSTPSFITEIPLKASPPQERTLRVRFDAARQVYNACLGESLKRLNLMRQSQAYRRAVSLPKSTGKERTSLFRESQAANGFREYDLHAYAKQFNHAWLGDHLDSNTVQKLATRVFKSVQQYAFGVRGKPRFKGKNRLRSVEGKTKKQGIMWRDGQVKWLGLTLAAIIPADDPVIQHGRTSRIKYVRLVKRNLNGKDRYFVQLVNEGQPYHKPKNKVGSGVVGLDIGPSTMAIVAPDVAHVDLKVFGDELVDQAAAIKRLQRKRSRQERVNNPTNFETDRWVKKDKNWKRKKGRVKTGARGWEKSNRQQRVEVHLAETQRKMAAHRKVLHGKMVNQILAMGNQIKTEKLSYRAFQKKYGKSVGLRAPGMFVTMLARKAETAGGYLYQFPTRSTKLSQTCHNCGTIEKKPLGQRWHSCRCGITAQRDLYSAFLACCVESDRLIIAEANELWPGVETSLLTATSRIQSVSGGHLPTSFGVNSRSQNGSSGKSKENPAEACDVVATSMARAHERPEVFRTPRL